MKPIHELTKLFLLYDQKSGIKKPVELSAGQAEIFDAIVSRSPKRVHVQTPSQYGKSLVCALAVLLRAMTFPEKWAVVAPSESKAMIIMRYVIEHIFDNEIFQSQLEVNEPLERLKRERSKKRITFKRGGEIFILSADSSNKQAAGETLMGFGAANIILDESCLIDDDIYAKIKRMLGGHEDNFLLEIGNPFKRNHFLRSFRNDDYKKIIIDWKQAVEEGRMQEDFVNEMRKEAFFDVLYEVKFPPEDSVDLDGWSALLTEHEVTNSFRDELEINGTKKMGLDIARSGGNFNVWTLRSGPVAKIIGKNSVNNLMEVIGITHTLCDAEGVDYENVYIDATGLGAGVYDRFKEAGFTVNGINMSSAADDPEKYANKRAECYFRLREWLKAGGMLQKNNDFLQLTDIKFKMRSSGKLKIIDKDSLRKRGIPSPDVADSLMLTFADVDEVPSMNFSENRMKQPKYA